MIAATILAAVTTLVLVGLVLVGVAGGSPRRPGGLVDHGAPGMAPEPGHPKPGRGLLARASLPGKAPAGDDWADALGPLPSGWTASEHSLVIGGQDRSYLMVRPAPVAGSSLPVVVLLHGRGMTPEAMERVTHLVDTTGPAILVYPAGYGRSWNAGACCGAAHQAGIDDVAFLAAVVRQVAATQPDAAHRVYLVGYSNGGRMAYRMACQDPGVFNGVAAVEAVPVAGCARTRPVPIMIVASQDDPLLAINPGDPRKEISGYLEPTVASALRAWRELDGCAASHRTWSQGQVTVSIWNDCQDGAQVALALYQRGSHAWPENRPGTPPAQSLVWEFMRGVAAYPR